MKIFVAVVLVVALSLTSASPSPEQVEKELLTYAQSQVGSVVRKPSLARIGGGLACYDRYIPLITAATTNSKVETQTCVNRATGRREDELNKVKDQRAALDMQVQTVRDTLEGCSQQEDVLQFLSCLRDSSQLLQATIEEVTKTSTTLANGLSSVYAVIDNSEDLCIQGVIDKVKSDTDALTAALQSCLMNGFDEPQPESTPEPEQPTEGPQPETSPQPEPTEQPTEGPQPESTPAEPTIQPSSAEPQPETSSVASELFPNYDLMPEESL